MIFFSRSLTVNAADVQRRSVLQIRVGHFRVLDPHVIQVVLGGIAEFHHNRPRTRDHLKDHDHLVKMKKPVQSTLHLLIRGMLDVFVERCQVSIGKRGTHRRGDFRRHSPASVACTPLVQFKYHSEYMDFQSHKMNPQIKYKRRHPIRHVTIDIHV